MPYRIPYAVGNFEKLIERGYYFVDKTAYLQALEQYQVPVFLRPRRFGKSLWCSLLECYDDIERREKFEQLFGPRRTPCPCWASLRQMSSIMSRASSRIMAQQ